MTNITKSQPRKDMRLHTNKAFEVIDAYLPHPYVNEVRKLVRFSPSTIRNVRSTRSGNIKIIKALLKVALKNKSELENIDSLLK